MRVVLEQLAPLPPAEWRYFERRLRPCDLQARGVITREGEVASCFGFVVSGLVKKVHVTEGGRVVVRGFGGPGSLVGAYASLLTQQPSYLRVEALRPSQLLLVDWSLMPDLYARHACWQSLGRRIAESMLLEREARAHELFDAERQRALCALLSHARRAASLPTRSRHRFVPRHQPGFAQPTACETSSRPVAAKPAPGSPSVS